MKLDIAHTLASSEVDRATRMGAVLESALTEMVNLIVVQYAAFTDPCVLALSVDAAMDAAAYARCATADQRRASAEEILQNEATVHLYVQRVRALCEQLLVGAVVALAPGGKAGVA